jgi:hypothetical protein
MDDGLACSNRPKVFKAILEHLRKKFQVRTLPPNRFVGLDITRNREDRTPLVNQSDFIRRILKRYNMEDCNQVSIPADPNNRVNAKMSPNTEEDKREMEKCPVREAIGSLIYLANKPRPDISFAVNQISVFCIKSRLWTLGSDETGTSFPCWDQEPWNLFWWKKSKL